MAEIESSFVNNVSVQSAYRTTCDNCMRSKVRCSKDHPSCHRCLSQGVTCIYSQSRRSKKVVEYRDTTKRARSAAKDMAEGSNIGSPSPGNVKVQSPATNLRDDCTYPSNAFPLTNNQEYPSPWSLFRSDGDVQETLMGLEDVDMFEGVEGLMGSEEAMTELQEPSQDQVIHLPSYQWSKDTSTGEAPIPISMSPEISSDFTSCILTCSDDSPSDSFLDKNSLTSTTSVADSFEDGSNNNGCAWIAASILKSLESPGAPLQSGSQPSYTYSRLRRNLDTVISTNKAAMEILQRISSCTCSIPSNHLVIISAVLFIVLAWYEACLDACTRACEQGAVKVGSEDSLFEMKAGIIGQKESLNAGNRDRAELVYIPPIQVGSLQLSVESRRQVVAQIVLTELAKVTRVMETLTERSQGSSGYQELEAQLQLSLRATLQMRIKKISQGAERASK